MPVTELNCRTCGKIFTTTRASHKGRNPTFCSNKCKRCLIDKNDIRLKWRLGKGFWQIASDEEKLHKLKELYEKNVIKTDSGCWGWKNKLMDNGYAKIGMGVGKIITAHRLSWILHYGNIPNGMNVLHSCDQRDCSKISHLFIGDHDDNMKDMVNKSRQMKGLNHYCVKLDENKVREIKKLIKDGYGNYAISKMFNVNSGTIQNISIGRTWKHVKDI